MNPALDLTPNNQLHHSVARLIARAIHHYKMELEKQFMDIEVFKARCWLIEASTLEQLSNRVSKLENDIGKLQNDIGKMQNDMQTGFEGIRKLIMDQSTSSGSSSSILPSSSSSTLPAAATTTATPTPTTRATRLRGNTSAASDMST